MLPASTGCSGKRSILTYRQKIAERVVGGVVAGREGPIGVVIRLEGEANLLEVVLALCPRRGGANLLDGGNEQGDQHADDGDDNQ